MKGVLPFINYGQNDWDYWTVFIQEKNNSVWEATLNIANTANGEKILYDIDPIKMVEGPVESVPATTNNSISDSNAKSQEKFSDRVIPTGIELPEGTSVDKNGKPRTAQAQTDGNYHRC